MQKYNVMLTPLIAFNCAACATPTIRTVCLGLSMMTPFERDDAGCTTIKDSMRASRPLAVQRNTASAAS